MTAWIVAGAIVTAAMGLGWWAGSRAYRRWENKVVAQALLCGAVFEHEEHGCYELGWNYSWIVKKDDWAIIGNSKAGVALAYLKHVGAIR